MFAVPALALTIALGGCRAGNAHNTNSGAPVSQNSNSSGAPSATGTSSTGAGGTSTSSNAALQQLENADNQNQGDQQQLNNAQNNAGVDYSSQDTPIQP
jgi:hypothetical protein